MKIEKSFRDAHDSLTEIYTELQRKVDEVFQSACKIEKEWHFTSRVKEMESYVLKVLTGRCEGYIIDDFFACTLIVPNLVFVEEAKRFVESNFTIVEEKPGLETKKFPTEFNFDGLRYTCKLKASVKPSPIEDLSFEVQVKTFLEHAWAVATHSFSYKGTEISWAKERLSAQIKAVLDNADLTILEAESLSESSFLKRINPKYEKISTVIEFLQNEFQSNVAISMPKDFKRLAEEIYNVLIRLDLNIEDIRQALKTETDVGRGHKTRNLSIYGLILESIRHQYPEKLKRGLLSKNRHSRRIVIPPEIAIDKEICDQKLTNVTILADKQFDIKKITGAI